MTGTYLTVGAAEANRSFSRLLRQVREGARVTITSHGEPVAELTPPVNRSDEQSEQATRSLALLEAHWADRRPVLGPRWSRDEIYDYLDK